jgi:ribose transport system ATP-binding protein
MSAISKRFGATRALRDVSLEVAPGEVHALIGENGAGKSTLMKILAGVHQADEGDMTVGGAPYHPAGPAAARASGVAMIYQELTLAPHLSVEANLLLGLERTRGGWLRGRLHRRLAREALNRLSQQDVPLHIPVGRLSNARQQLVEIARALVCDARVLVFDEPTSSLTEADTEQLFSVIRQLRETGLGIIYISHFLEEVAQIADKFTVLRDGQVVGNGKLTDVSLDDIVRLMVGRELTQLFPHVPHEPAEPLLDISDLTGARLPMNVSCQIRRGEIFGLAGLIGAGRSELLRCIYGLDPIRRGTVRIAGIGPAGRSVTHSLKSGLGLVSEDRKTEGLALEQSIADNMTLASLAPYARLGWLRLAYREEAVRAWMREMHVRAAGPSQAVGELSGGNQQKVAIARLLHQQSEILLLDEPTRGIDVGTKAEIYRLIGNLAARGNTVIMVSSYLPELLNVCDRIGVMCRGQLREVRPAREWTDESIMHCATGREEAA